MTELRIFELQEDVPYIVTRECHVLQKGFHVRISNGVITCKEHSGYFCWYSKNPSKYNKIYQRARFVLDKDSINNFIKFYKAKIGKYEKLLERED